MASASPFAASNMPQPDRARPAAEEPLNTHLLLRAGLVLGLLAGLTLAICLSAPKIGAALALGGNTTETVPRDIVIGADHLRIPSNYLRFEDQRQSGAAERIDLYATWPDMLGYSGATSARFNDISRPDGLIFLQISQSTMSRDMTGRIEPIYRHLFEGDPRPGPAGLMAHTFAKSSGYGAETFYTASTATPDAVPTYGVRCILPQQPALSTSADCQRDIHVGQDLVVIYRFSSQLLPQWRAIEAQVVRFVEEKLIP
jgi:hypothetical protein